MDELLSAEEIENRYYETKLEIDKRIFSAKLRVSEGPSTDPTLAELFSDLKAYETAIDYASLLHENPY